MTKLKIKQNVSECFLYFGFSRSLIGLNKDQHYPTSNALFFSQVYFEGDALCAAHARMSLFSKTPNISAVHYYLPASCCSNKNLFNILERLLFRILSLALLKKLLPLRERLVPAWLMLQQTRASSFPAAIIYTKAGNRSRSQ